MNVDEKRVKLVILQLKQIDDSGNVVYSNATPIPVNENDTFKDIEKKILESSELPTTVREDIENCLNNPIGDRGIVYCVIDKAGHRNLINPKSRVAEEIDRYGTSNVHMDIARTVCATKH